MEVPFLGWRSNPSVVRHVIIRSELLGGGEGARSWEQTPSIPDVVSLVELHPQQLPPMIILAAAITAFSLGPRSREKPPKRSPSC